MYVGNFRGWLTRWFNFRVRARAPLRIVQLRLLTGTLAIIVKNWHAWTPRKFPTILRVLILSSLTGTPHCWEFTYTTSLTFEGQAMWL